jgi:hypothetical protein
MHTDRRRLDFYREVLHLELPQLFTSVSTFLRTGRVGTFANGIKSKH